MPTLNKSTLLIIGAFAAIYIIWGSTYLFAAFAMDQLPPFFMAGTRYFISGALPFFLTFNALVRLLELEVILQLLEICCNVYLVFGRQHIWRMHLSVSIILTLVHGNFMSIYW